MNLCSETLTDSTGNVLFRVALTNDDGSVMTKTLTPESFIKLIQNGCTQELCYMHLGKLPEGYIDCSVADERSFRILIKVPAEKRLLVHTSGHYQIPFPDLVFYLYVKNGLVQKFRCYAMKRDTLYFYPFGNVSANGEICMGNISCTDITLNKTMDVIENFLGGKTNNDYFSPKNKVNNSYSQQTMLEKLSKMDAFPQRWLKKDPNNTLADLKKLIRKEKWR